MPRRTLSGTRAISRPASSRTVIRFITAARRSTTGREKLLGRQADVARDLPKKERRDVPSAVKRDRRLPAVGVPKLTMRAALPDDDETEALEEPFDLPRLQHGKGRHGQATWTV